MDIARKKRIKNLEIKMSSPNIPKHTDKQKKSVSEKTGKKEVLSNETKKEGKTLKRKSTEGNDESVSKKKVLKAENGDQGKVTTPSCSYPTKNTKPRISKQSSMEIKTLKVKAASRDVKNAKEVKLSSNVEKKTVKKSITHDERCNTKDESVLNSNKRKRKVQNNKTLEVESTTHKPDGAPKLKANLIKKVKDTSQERGREEKKERKIAPIKNILNNSSTKESKEKNLSNKRLKSKAKAHRDPEKKQFNTAVSETNVDDPMAMLMMMEGGQKLDQLLSATSNVSKSDSDLSEKNDDEMSESDDSDEISDWEDVKDHTLPVEEDHSQGSIEPVQITLDLPDFLKKKRKKKQFDWKVHLEKQVRKFKKDVAINIHKSHILCLIAHGLRQNSILNDETVSGLAMSLIPTQFNKTATVSTERLVDAVMLWYRKKFPLDQVTHTSGNSLISVDLILKALSKSSIVDARLWVFVFLVILRVLGLSVRLVLSLQPIPYKTRENGPSSSKGSSKGNGNTKNRKSATSTSDSKPLKHKTSKPPSSSSSSSSKKQSLSSSSSLQRTPSARRSSHEARVKSHKNLKEESDNGDSSEEESNKNKNAKTKNKKSVSKKTKPDEKAESSGSEFEATSPYFRQPKELKIKSNRKMLSHSEDDDDGSGKAHDFWLEVYVENKQKWTCYDCFKNVFGRPYLQEKRATQPVTYVVAYRNDNGVRDVTPRYAKQWISHTRKIRVDADWLEQTFSMFDKTSYEDRVMEEDEIKSQLMVRPMPSNIGDFKNHPLYALSRHLLKFEAIYPETAIPLGYIRQEPIYARECVRTLHSRDNWLKEGRLVRLKEEPYKMVKSRPKWHKPKENPDELDLELFGEWQTEIYIPPPAVNGKVPRNDYGNVELFKPWMLPTGTVQLRLQGLQRVAKKLNIDVAPAMVGWDHHSGHAHPVFDGFIVCEEFADALLDAWDEDQEIQKQKEDEKREKRVYGNWKLLIRGLLIRERLKMKFLQDGPLMDPLMTVEEKKEETGTSKSGEKTASVSTADMSTQLEGKPSEVEEKTTGFIKPNDTEEIKNETDTGCGEKKKVSNSKKNVKVEQENEEKKTDCDDFESVVALTGTEKGKSNAQRGRRRSDRKGNVTGKRCQK